MIFYDFQQCREIQLCSSQPCRDDYDIYSGTDNANFFHLLLLLFAFQWVRIWKFYDSTHDLMIKKMFETYSLCSLQLRLRRKKKLFIHFYDAFFPSQHLETRPTWLCHHCAMMVIIFAKRLKCDMSCRVSPGNGRSASTAMYSAITTNT